MTTLAALNSQQAMQSRLAEDASRASAPCWLRVRLSSCAPNLLFLLLDVPKWSSATGGRSTAHSSTSAAWDCYSG